MGRLQYQLHRQVKAVCGVLETFKSAEFNDRESVIETEEPNKSSENIDGYETRELRITIENGRLGHKSH